MDGNDCAQNTLFGRLDACAEPTESGMRIGGYARVGRNEGWRRSVIALLGVA